jgi:hypothetical protein
MTDTTTTETKLRFRIKLLLAERDMTVANLYQLVKQQGFDISSSHFFRQMTPIRMPFGRNCSSPSARRWGARHPNYSTS